MLDRLGFDLWADKYNISVKISDEEDSYPFAGYKKVLNFVYNGVRGGKGARVLDLGFGTGVLAERLYKDGYLVTGVDFSRRMTELAAEKMPKARLIVHDLTRGLPAELTGERFDAVVCTYSIHHLNEEQKTELIRQILACLEPGGTLYIGDVAFETRSEREKCRRQSGDAWDEDEIYPVAEEIKQVFPQTEFEKISHCAGVLTIKNNKT